MTNDVSHTRTTGLIAAAPSFALALVMLGYWITPTAAIFGGATFSHRLLTAEVFAVIYAAFAGIAGAFATWIPRGREIAIVGVQLAVAGWIAWLFAHEPGIALFIAGFALLRTLPQLVDFARRKSIHPDEVARLMFTGLWAIGALILLSMCSRLMARYGFAVPALGLTPEVEAAQRAALELDPLTTFGQRFFAGRYADTVAGLVFYFVAGGFGAWLLHTRPLTGGNTVTQ
jgi:hypothetical protein